MGAPYGVPVTTWSNGDYNGATNTEDDLSVMTDRSAAFSEYLWVAHQDGTPYEGTQVCPIDGADPMNPQPGDEFYAVENGECTDEVLITLYHYADRADFAADEVGNTAEEATVLGLGGDQFETDGKIINRDDVDVYELNIDEGDVTATVDVAGLGPNLNASVTLLDADGNEVATDAGEPVRDSEIAASGLGASITATALEAGQYFLVVDGVGFGDPSTATADDAGGFSDYGSLGYYSLTGTAPEPEIVPVAINAPEDGAAVTGGDDVTVEGTGTAGATVVVTANGEVVDTVVVAEDGTWTATVAAEYGNTEIVATQDVDDSSATITVVAEVPAPEVADTEDGNLSDGSYTFTGTGTPGAAVVVTILTPSGETITLETTVDADGNWAVTLDEIEAGNYVVSARQTINGVQSDISDAVTISIADDTTGDDDGNDDGTGDEDDNELPDTGMELGFMGLGLMALLLVGGGALVVSRRFTTNS